MWENECKEVDWQDETEYVSFTYSVLSDYSECYFFKINRMKYENFYDQVDKIQFQRIKEIKEAQLKYFQFESFKLNIDVHNQLLADENKIRKKCNLKIMNEIITRQDFFKAIDECNKWLNSFKFLFSDWNKSENCLNSSLKFELNHRFPL